MLTAIKDLRSTSPIKIEKEVVISLENLIENTLKFNADKDSSQTLENKSEMLRKVLKRDAYFIE